MSFVGGTSTNRGPHTFTVSWNSNFPSDVSGICINQSNPIRVGDSVRFTGTQTIDALAYFVLQTNSNWQVLPNPTFGFPYALLLDHTITFTQSGCYYFVGFNPSSQSDPQVTNRRVRIEVFGTDASLTCPTCPGETRTVLSSPSQSVPPVGSSFSVSWDTSKFPTNGKGLCIGDTMSAMTTDVEFSSMNSRLVELTTNNTPIRVNDTITFVSPSGQAQTLWQANSSWLALDQPTYGFPITQSLNHTIQFRQAGCFYFISGTEPNRVRLRISITESDGTGGCTTTCPGAEIDPTPPTPPPDVIIFPTPPPPPPDNRSVFERFFGVIVAIIVVILLVTIVLVIWFVSRSNDKVPSLKSTELGDKNGFHEVHHHHFVNQDATGHHVSTHQSSLHHDGMPRTSQFVSMETQTPNHISSLYHETGPVTHTSSQQTSTPAYSSTQHTTSTLPIRGNVSQSSNMNSGLVPGPSGLS